MALCVICSTTVKRGLSDSITCILCNNIFHLNCIPLIQSDADYLKCIKKDWSCKNCLNEGAMSSNSKSVLPVPSSTYSNNIELILRKNEVLTSEQSKLIVLVNKQNEKLNSFDCKLSDLSAQLAAIKTENNTLSSNLAALTQRVVFLESDKPTLSKDSFSDFIDRQTRSKNIVLFNVPESQSDANNSDISTIQI